MRPIAFAIFLLLTYCPAAAVEPLTIVTEHWPPYQVVENGIATDGFSTMVVKAMLLEAGTPMTIRGFNWARAYKMALERPNIMVFGLFRSKQREDKFKWVGPLVRQVNSLWYIEGRKQMNIKTLDNAKQFRLAVAREDIRHQFLLSNGFSQNDNFDLVRDHLQAVSMLFLGRTDLVIGDRLNMAMTAKLAGFDPTKLREIPNLNIDLGELYVACSLKTPDEIVLKYQKALAAIKHKGIYAKLKTHYLPGHPF